MVIDCCNLFLSGTNFITILGPLLNEWRDETLFKWRLSNGITDDRVKCLSLCVEISSSTQVSEYYEERIVFAN